MSTEASPNESSGGPRRPSATLTLPLILFALMAALLAFALWLARTREPSELPSALIGKEVPQFSLAPVAGLPSRGLSSGMLGKGQVTLVNFWASWCTPCLAEHPQLSELRRLGLPLYGVNYKDRPEAARTFLARNGNPFLSIGADVSGMTAIDFGVYGVPETFVIDGDGRIVYRYPGPLSQEVVQTRILPAVERARAASRARS